MTIPARKSTRFEELFLRTKGGPLKIEPLELEGPLDDEVLVRIVASGICHTDIDMMDDWDSGETPVVLGHEGGPASWKRSVSKLRE